jgi:DnaD/phage-associated family protein
MFFSDILPAIADRAELVVTVYAFYLLGRKPAAVRFFVENELAAEAPLMRALQHVEDGGAGAIERGLEGAVRRGTLLRGVGRGDARPINLYVLNSPAGLDALKRVSGGAVVSSSDDVAEPALLANIFLLYEENFGVISPLLAEQLREAEIEYPWPWIVAAFREAVALNRRNWRYIERILQRWRNEGPDLEALRRSVEGHGGSLAGKYWRHVRH